MANFIIQVQVPIIATAYKFIEADDLEQAEEIASKMSKKELAEDHSEDTDPYVDFDGVKICSIQKE